MLHPTTDTHEPNLWDDVQDLSLGLTWDVRNTVGFGLLTESQQAEVLKGSTARARASEARKGGDDA